MFQVEMSFLLLNHSLYIEGTAAIDAIYPASTPEKSVTPIENSTGCLAKRRTPAPIRVVRADRNTDIPVPVLK